MNAVPVHPRNTDLVGLQGAWPQTAVPSRDDKRIRLNRGWIRLNRGWMRLNRDANCLFEVH